MYRLKSGILLEALSKGHFKYTSFGSCPTGEIAVSVDTKVSECAYLENLHCTYLSIQP